MKRRKRKPDIVRCLLWGIPFLGIPGLLITFFVLLSDGKEPPQTVPADMSSKLLQSASAGKKMKENVQALENAREEEVRKVARIAMIQTEWESLPAGTVLAQNEIDKSHLEYYFIGYEISDAVYGRIIGKSFQEGTEVGLNDLRYMKVLHYNFEHELQVGELIVATTLEEDFKNIFMELFAAEYEIQSMYLADNYWTGDPTTTDSASIEENNTSAFLYRPATGSSKLSKHAYGMAIDINPQQNPYVSYRTGEAVWDHANANDYIDRTTGLPHMITHDDICYHIFTKYGFVWGGDWEYIKDYQHFEKE